MLADLGTVFSGLAWAATLYGALASAISIYRRDVRWWQSARNALYGAAALLGLALIALTEAFLSGDYGIRYVAQHSSQALPIYLKLSAIWAGQEGSLLLWCFFQAVFTALAIRIRDERAAPLIPWATVVLGLIGALFVGAMLWLSNPFTQLPRPLTDGQGLNPLLRHPGMIFHPPAMYVGYVGLSVPFAFALAALITKNDRFWTRVVHPWTLVAWIGLSLGLLLGMRWAYDVLGWGGYWGWDPVENAGLMPWLTTTALLHGAVMQEERRGFRVWNYVLVTLSFVLVLFGTFATRSGAIQSVHAYAVSNLGGYYLAGILASLGVSVGLILWRGADLSSASSEPPLLSRDGAFFLTLLVFMTLTLSVFVGSVLPTITDLAWGQQFEAGPAWFDRVTGPQFALLILLIGVCPLLGRAAATVRRLKRRAWLIALGALVAVGAALVAGFDKPVSLIAFGLVGLSATTVLIEYGEGVAQRSRRTDLAPLNALWDLLRTQRRKYGGYLVHLGVIFMAVGVIGTRLYPFEQEMVMASGEPIEIGEYTLVFDLLSQEMVGDHLSTWASLSVYGEDEYLVTLEPRVNRYQNYEQTFSVPALRPALREDLYVILAGWSGDGTTITVRILINALANFLWLGGLVFLAGGALALWPRGLAGAWNAVAAMVIVGLLAGGAWAMWGARHGTAVKALGRPHVGHAAPEFRLSSLSGDALALSDLRGQVVVLNFWAPWCPTCKDELPDLQASWEAYQGAGVVFVGVAYDSDRAAVEETASAYGLSYPIGLDASDLAAQAYGVTKVPETFVIDAQGQVAAVYVGAVSQVELTAQLDSLLGD